MSARTPTQKASDADLVEVAPIREAFLRSGMTLSALALKVGWTRERGKPDTSRVGRQLGLMVALNRGRVELRQRVHYDVAVLFVRAMDLYPVDFDL